MESSIHAFSCIAYTHIFNCYVNDRTCVVAQPCGALVPLSEAHERESCWLPGWMAVEKLYAPLGGCIHIACGMFLSAVCSSWNVDLTVRCIIICSPAEVKWGGMPLRILYVIHVSKHVSITGNYNRDLNAVRLDACLFITDIRNFVRVDFLHVAAMHLCDSINDSSHFHNLTSVSCVFYLLSSSQIGK